MSPPKDLVNLPDHYARFPIEPVRFIGENKLGFIPGNIIKYVMRWDAKDGLQDLFKARRYLDMLIAYVEGNSDWWTTASSNQRVAVADNIAAQKEISGELEPVFEQVRKAGEPWSDYEPDLHELDRAPLGFVTPAELRAQIKEKMDHE